MSEILEKTLTVCRAAQGKKYTNTINIKGEYLKAYGFAHGTKVKVRISHNKITIEGC
ncbi:MAG: type I addiction module toxin, SymE family [Bacteroidia bacterium]|nr:type I addiction module toxin, SymE family [Bacteroidia bacterium]